MNWLLNYFNYPSDSLLVFGTFDPLLVTLSVAIAIFTSYMALQIAGQARLRLHKKRKHLTLAAGSAALGGGVWSMHFIGMLAFDLCTDVNYAADLTLLSMLPSIAASWVALNLISKQHFHLSQLIVGGLLVGAGIGTMHYVGMAAMQMAPLLRYDPWFFSLSIVMAVSLAILALWVKFGINRYFKTTISENHLNLISGTVMGSAISGMHYTGMAAARFVQPAGTDLPPVTGDDSALLAMGIAITTITLTIIVVGVNLVLKYRDISRVANASEKRLLAMMDTAIDGIVTTDEQGIIKSANQAVHTIYGWQPDEVINQPVSMLLPPERRSDFSLLKYAKYSENSLSGVAQEVDGLHKNGHSIPIRLVVGHADLPDEQLFVAFVSDISQRLAMEKSVRDNEEKYRSLIGNIPGAAYRCLNQADWPMLFISDAIEIITGFPASDFILPNPKRSMVELYHPDDKALIVLPEKSDDPFNLEYRIIRKDGAVRWILETGDYVRDEQGNIIWLDGFMMDITSRKSMEENLMQSRDKAEQAVVAKTAFLANMSHEIRTPMNAIIGFSNVLLDSPLEREQHKHLTTINHSANSLLHLLNDILDSAKLEKGKLELEMFDFSLSNQLDMVLSTLSIQANNKQINLQLNLSKQLKEYYYGAADRIRQVLTNLIGNAIKFTEQGEVNVDVRLNKQQHILFSIQDSGIGISPDRLSSIFDAFTQADASMSRRFGGTGLGTTISKQLVEQMGGQIWVESTPGEGSRFEFTLPLLPGKKPVQQENANTLPIPPMSILVADDIQQNRDLLILLLGKAGHTVTTAMNGQQAVTSFENQQLDLILMDVQMPHLDGLQASKAIRQIEQQKGLSPIPIIALTASVLAEDKLAAKNAGMNGFASKPVNFSVLCAEIANVMELNIDTQYVSDNAATGADTGRLIDLQQGISIWGDQPTYVKELLRFAEKYQTIPASLQTLLDEGDLSQLAQKAHAYRGLCGNLAINKLDDLFTQLETAAQQQQTDQCHNMIASLIQQIDQLDEQISTLPDQAATTETCTPEKVDKQKLQALCNLLIRAAKQNEMDESAMQQLFKCAASLHEKRLIQIEHAFDEFEFDQAVELLTQLIDDSSE